MVTSVGRRSPSGSVSASRSSTGVSCSMRSASGTSFGEDAASFMACFPFFSEWGALRQRDHPRQRQDGDNSTRSRGMLVNGTGSGQPNHAVVEAVSPVDHRRSSAVAVLEKEEVVLDEFHLEERLADVHGF